MQTSQLDRGVINKHDESKVDVTSGGRAPQAGSIVTRLKMPYNAE